MSVKNQGWVVIARQTVKKETPLFCIAGLNLLLTTNQFNEINDQYRRSVPAIANLVWQYQP
jgi:hypothetical protein